MAVPPEFHEYLGDGVYARFDGYQVWVRAEREGVMHEVALEPNVLSELDEYWRKIRAHYADHYSAERVAGRG